MLSYQKTLEKWHKNTNKVVIEWSELQKILNIYNYVELTEVIKNLQDINILQKYGTKSNGRKPNLYMKYKYIVEEKDYSELIKEIEYDLAPELDKTYYKQKLSAYERDREDVLAISEYIKHCKHLLNVEISINERSFEIFKREKYMKSRLKGITSIMKNLGLDENFFNYCETCPPIAYYSVSKEIPQNVLIIENQDTYNSIRKYIKSISKNVMGVEISTVIYGGGNGRLPSINEIEEYTDDYVSNLNNTFYYFGDIDYSGISIYESYRERNKEKIDWVPFKEGYEYMLDKIVSDINTLDDINSLPNTKDGQKDNRKGIFMNFFNDNYKNKIDKILSNRKYMPQEALNFNDLISYNKE